MSQQKLAAAVGVSRQTIYKWESGGAIPSADNLGFLSAALEVSPDYFICAIDSGAGDKTSAECCDVRADVGAEAQDTECAACADTKKKLVFKMIIAVTAVGFCVCLLFAVITGCISLSTNTGDRVISTVSVDRSVFIALAVGSGALLIALITEISLYVVKIR